MKLKKFYRISIVIAGLAISGCADEATCIPEYTDLLNISFVDESGKAKEITVVSLEAEGANENFPIIQDSTFTTLSIPLNPLDSVIKLNFVQASETNSIIFSYHAIQRLTDPKCGLETLFDQVKVKDTDFIEAQIVNSVLNKDIKTNVKITH